MQEFSWGEARTVILTNVSEMIKLNMYIIVISIMLCLCSLYCSEVATVLHKAGKKKLLKSQRTNQPVMQSLPSRCLSLQPTF